MVTPADIFAAAVTLREELKHVKAWLEANLQSNNDHNFVKIYENLPKFGNLGKIGNLNFSVTTEIRYLCHVTSYGRVQERKEN